MANLTNSKNYNIPNHAILSKENERDLFMAYKKTCIKKERDVIRNFIINHNIKFVAGVAFTYKTKYANIDIRDIIAYGILGLFPAIEKYDINQYDKFITYAVYWIKQSITANIQHNEGAVRFPVHIHRIIQIAMNKGKYEEIANEMNTMLGGTSLDKKVSNDSNVTIGEYQRDQNDFSNPDHNLKIKILNDTIIKSLDNELKSTEKKVLTSYYGFDCECFTMEELGEKFSVSKEAIRIRKNNALKKLRKCNIMKNLKAEYIG